MYGNLNLFKYNFYITTLETREVETTRYHIEEYICGDLGYVETVIEKHEDKSNPAQYEVLDYCTLTLFEQFVLEQELGVTIDSFEFVKFVRKYIKMEEE